MQYSNNILEKYESRPRKWWLYTLIVFIMALLLSWYGGSAIKKHAPVFYVGAALLALTTIAVTWSGADAWIGGSRCISSPRSCGA